MSQWNFADVWEAVADALPDAPALVHGDRTLTWPEFDRRADDVGRWLLDAGVGRAGQGGPLPLQLPGVPRVHLRRLKVGLVPINTNYRYADDELVYLWENADAVAVVFHGASSSASRGSATGCPASGAGCGSTTARPPARRGPSPTRRRPETTGRPRADGHQRVRAPWGRGPDDLHMLYTGGTTGMPKGVMWRQDDLFARLNGGGFRRYPPEGGDRRRPAPSWQRAGRA